MPRTDGGDWPCRIEREPGGDHDELPSVRNLVELATRAAAHGAHRVVVSERVYVELVAQGAAPARRPAGITVCASPSATSVQPKL